MGAEKQYKDQVKAIFKSLLFPVFLIFALLLGLIFLVFNPEMFIATEKTDFIEVPVTIEDTDKIENGIHVATGFVEGEGMDLVIQNCTSCHSAKLVTQNRMTKEKWLATIRWMQESQNLWDLGVNEAPILEYLSSNYAPTTVGRRANLIHVEWYKLKE